MALQRELPPVGSDDLPSLIAWIDRQFRYVFDMAVRLDDALLFIADILKDAGIAAFWLWDDSQVVGDPGDQEMRGNAVLLADVTIFSISKVNVLQNGITSWLVRIKVGDLLQVADESTGVEQFYSVTAAAIDQGSWWQVGVAQLQGGVTNPGAGDIMTFRWFPQDEDLRRVLLGQIGP